MNTRMKLYRIHVAPAVDTNDVGRDWWYTILAKSAQAAVDALRSRRMMKPYEDVVAVYEETTDWW